MRPASTTKETRNQAIRAWVQATRIGLDAFADSETLVAWASDLADGRPLGDVELRLGSGAARSDASGLARLALGDAPAPLLVARRGKDLAILPSQTGWWAEGAGWRRTARTDTLRFLVFDDRKMYRPGETVRVKGWLRRIGAGPRGDVEALPPEVSALAWTLVDSQGNEVGKGEARVSGLGGFDLALDLPKTMNLGSAALRLEARGGALGGQQHAHAFEVQEFRRPEFEVKAAASEGPFLVGDAATVTVTAAYYAGGALPGAEVSWRVVATPGHVPAAEPGRLHLRHVRALVGLAPATRAGGPRGDEGRAHRRPGAHRLRVDFDRGDPPRPHVVRAEATVMDVNRQAWTAGADLLVHPVASATWACAAERAFVQKGEPIAIEAIVTDLDGRRRPRPAAAAAGRAARLGAGRGRVEGGPEGRPGARGPVRGGGRAGPLRGEGGRRLARRRPRRRRAGPRERDASSGSGWPAGGVPPRRDLEEEKVTLVPDRKEYRAGDVGEGAGARALRPRRGPPDPAPQRPRARASASRIDGGSHTLEIPIKEAFTPNVHVQVDLVGAGAARGGARGTRRLRVGPAFASGSLDLPVPPAARTLGLTVTPARQGARARRRDRARPRRARRRRAGRWRTARWRSSWWTRPCWRSPATGSRTARRLLRPARGADVTDHRLRAHVLLAPAGASSTPAGRGGRGCERAAGGRSDGPRSTAAPAAPAPRAAAAPARWMRSEGDVGRRRAAPEPIRARTDFVALALFAASVPTDAEGRARVPVKLPDSLTRYRVMAVAAAGPRSFGSGEATLTARLPLMVRPSPPRFLNFGDRFELPVVVQNQTDAAMTVDVAVRARNAALTAGAGRRLMVPANDRVEVRFPMAAVRAGHGALPGRRRLRDGSPTPPRWSCRSGRRPPPRPSPPTARSTRAASSSP